MTAPGYSWLLVACTLLAASPAIAEQKAFERLDANRDGSITATEAAFEPALWLEFDEADADHDRRLSREEFDRWAKKARPAGGPSLLLPPPR